MDFVLPPEIEAIRLRIRRFVDDRLVPLESDRANYDEHENIAPHVLAETRKAAKAEGLWALQLPKAIGGQGLPRIGEWKRRIGPLPLVAIGGITLERAQGCFDAGADAVAMVSDITRHTDPDARTRDWLRATRCRA